MENLKKLEMIIENALKQKRTKEVQKETSLERKHIHALENIKITLIRSSWRHRETPHTSEIDKLIGYLEVQEAKHNKNR